MPIPSSPLRLAAWVPTLGLIVAVHLAAPATAQEEPEQPPPRRTTEPGKGPQIPFDPTRWEFWWYFNRERWLGLERLQRGEAKVGASERPSGVRVEDRRRRIVPALVRGLRDPNPDVRKAVLHALAKSGEADVRPYLFYGLRDADYQVRLQAILALGVWGDSQAVDRLEEVLNGDSETLQARFYAAVALGLLGEAAGPSFRIHLSPDRFVTLEPMVQSGVAYGGGLTRDQALASGLRELAVRPGLDDTQVRSNVVVSLGKCGTEADVPILLEALRHRSVHVRRSAAVGVGVLAEGSADDDVTKALRHAVEKDADLTVRNFAALSLGRVGGEEALAFLVSRIDQAAVNHRSFVALALGLARSADARPRLEEMLARESDLSFRGALAIALGLIGHRGSAAGLREVFDATGEPVLKGYVGLALGMIGDVESVERLRAALAKGTDVELIPNLALALALIGDTETSALLVRRIQQERNEFVRQSLLYSVGWFADRAAIDALVDTLLDRSEVAYIRQYAAVALGMLVDRQPIRAIARASSDSNYTIQANFLEEIFKVL